MNKTKNTIFSAVTYFFYNFQLSNFFLRNLQQSPKKPSPPKKQRPQQHPCLGLLPTLLYSWKAQKEEYIGAGIKSAG